MSFLNPQALNEGRQGLTRASPVYEEMVTDSISRRSNADNHICSEFMSVTVLPYSEDTVFRSSPTTGSYTLSNPLSNLPWALALGIV